MHNIGQLLEVAIHEAFSLIRIDRFLERLCDPHHLYGFQTTGMHTVLVLLRTSECIQCMHMKDEHRTSIFSFSLGNGMPFSKRNTSCPCRRHPENQTDLRFGRAFRILQKEQNPSLCWFGTCTAVLSPTGYDGDRY